MFKDMLVLVYKLIILIDFMVLDMDKYSTLDKERTILLGRPYMATTITFIDIQAGNLTMIVLGEVVHFKFLTIYVFLLYLPSMNTLTLIQWIKLYINFFCMIESRIDINFSYYQKGGRLFR